MKNEHTPTPWTNGYGPNGIAGPNTPSIAGVTVEEYLDRENTKDGEPYPKSKHCIITVGMDTVAICVGPNREENAALITRAVNSHDELLAALKEMVEANGGVAVMPTEEARKQNAALAQARAAIARAEAQ